MASLELEIHNRSKRFRAEIARRALLIPQREEVTYAIPNTPFGVKKVQPMLPVRKAFNQEPLWWHCMWMADLVADRSAKPPGPPTIDLIQRTVARAFGVSRGDLIAERRTQNVVLPRQIAMYLAKTLTLRSYPEIGRRTGDRDHTTVIHAVRKIAARCVSDPEFAGRIEQLKAELRA